MSQRKHSNEQLFSCITTKFAARTQHLCYEIKINLDIYYSIHTVYACGKDTKKILHQYTNTATVFPSMMYMYCHTAEVCANDQVALFRVKIQQH
jgi:hypothetical protein